MIYSNHTRIAIRPFPQAVPMCRAYAAYSGENRKNDLMLLQRSIEDEEN